MSKYVDDISSYDSHYEGSKKYTGNSQKQEGGQLKNMWVCECEYVYACIHNCTYTFM